MYHGNFAGWHIFYNSNDGSMHWSAHKHGVRMRANTKALLVDMIRWHISQNKMAHLPL